MQLTQNIEQLGQRVGGTAEMSIGEGKQDAPVGTTLALIEQATKTMDAVHKRLTSAQGKEFQLLKERFKEDPEAFWRHDKKASRRWQKDQFLQALENNNLVPVADPNNPTSMHRIAKAVVIKTLQAAAPDLYDPIAVDTRIMRITGIDPEGLFRQTPAPPPPNPSLIAAQAKQQANQQQGQLQTMQMLMKLEIEKMQSQDKMADRQSREKIEAMKIILERLKIQEEQIIHGQQVQQDAQAEAMKILMDHHRQQQQMQNDISIAQQKHSSDMHMKMGGVVSDAIIDHATQQQETQLQLDKHNQEMQLQRDKHERELRMQEDRSEAELRHRHEMDQREQAHKEKLAKIDADAKITIAKATAKLKPKPKPASKSK
jgi:hypothetical protein